MKYRIFILLLSIGILAVPRFVFAGGNDYNPLFGARTLALNGLYFAGSDGLTCSLANPAGFAYLNGMDIQAMVIDRLGLQEFNSPVMGLYRSYREDDLSFGGGGYWNINPNLTAAFSYSRVLDYSVSWPFAFLAADNATILAFDMDNSFHVDAIAPSVAVKLGTFSIGLTIDIYNVQQAASFPQLNIAASSGKGLEAYQFSLNQKAWAYGFNLGVIANLSTDLRIGAAIKSGYKANLSGDAVSDMFMEVDSASAKTNLSSTFQMPWSIGVGIIYQLAPDLKLNIDAAYTLWGGIQNSMNLKYSDQTWQNGLNHVDSISGIQGNLLNLSYKNTLDFGMGLEYLIDEGTYLRFGYRFSQMPNSNATYSFLMSGVNQHSLSIGIGYNADEYTIDAGLIYSFGVSRDVTNNYHPNLSGTYSSDSYVPTITIKYAF